MNPPPDDEGDAPLRAPDTLSDPGPWQGWDGHDPDDEPDEDDDDP